MNTATLIPLPVRLLALWLGLLCPLLQAEAAEPPPKVDVCIYGATPAGIVAAVAAKQEGCSVVLVEPSRWLGGILGAGLKPLQDCPEPVAVGGLTASRIFTMRQQPDLLREDFAKLLASEGIMTVSEVRPQHVEKEGAAITRIVLKETPLADVWNQTEVADGIGRALYGVDIYPVRRYALADPRTGQMGVATEGNVFVGGAKGTGHPYPIP